MEKVRCGWCLSSDLYKKYHDEEWGTPVYDEETLFEFLILETFQAGLSWITILNKRENFRVAFDHFDYQKIALYEDSKIEELLQDAGIIRNKLKIYSAVTNAQAFIKIQEELGSFSNYIWQFTNAKTVDNRPKTLKEVPATTLLSDAISKDLKKRGFKFVGSTVVYAYLQATGIINDHILDCWTRR
ncbi:DNA-3-methyladenine glycosylase I [Flavobacterium sp. TMP13]|uniref:DNA-3-methyladenine glycosylase I n=1 Tax=Flavobacterium sp. TMP13 TaxID=3425950 RepID=UPI003D77DE6E